LRCTARLTNYP
jgi:F-type H+-transporting ATPase subunit O